MSRIPSWLIKVVGLALVYFVVLALIKNGVVDSYLEITIVTICVNIILAASLNLITGFTGQFSLGHAGFMALGAYTTGIITVSHPTIWGFMTGLLAGACLAALVGFVIGLPTLRLSGDYLAIATLGLAEIIRIVITNLKITKGAAGLSGIPRFVDWTWLFIITAGSVALIANLLRSVPGRDLIAVREDEIAASSVGVNALTAKTTAFVVGAFFGGLAGGLYASYFFVLKPDIFNFLKSVNILIIVVLGGLGSLTGTVIGAVLLGVVSYLLRSYPAVQDLQWVIYGLILVIVMVFRPQGLVGDRELTMAAVRRLVPGRLKKGAPT